MQIVYLLLGTVDEPVIGELRYMDLKSENTALRSNNLRLGTCCIKATFKAAHWHYSGTNSDGDVHRKPGRSKVMFLYFECKIGEVKEVPPDL
jgi:hypothetical protein